MSLRFYIYCKNTGQDQILIACYKAIFVTVNTVKAIFSSSHVQLWELDHKEGWALKNWYFRTKVLEKILESASDSKDIKPVNPIHWNDWCWSSNTLDTCCEELTHWKRPWCWERLRARGEGDNRVWDGWMASDSMDMRFEQNLGDSEGQGSLACCWWDCKELDTT